MKKKKEVKKTKTAKAVKSAKAVKAVKVKAVELPARPTLESILDEADHAFTDMVRRYWALGQALVKAITYYGSEGRKAFSVRFPLTENALRNLEYVGRGMLLPNFTMCSNKFTLGLVKMKDSESWQYKLVGASHNGFLRVRNSDGKLVDRAFEDFVKPAEVDCLLSIVGESDENLTPAELGEKIEKLHEEVRKNFPRKVRKPYVISRAGTGKPVVRFYRTNAYTAESLEKITKQLREEEEKATQAQAQA